MRIKIECVLGDIVSNEYFVLIEYFLKEQFKFVKYSARNWMNINQLRIPDLKDLQPFLIEEIKHTCKYCQNCL